MYRRALLATTAAVVVAGCVDGDSTVGPDAGGADAGDVNTEDGDPGDPADPADPTESSESNEDDAAAADDLDAGSVVIAEAEAADVGEASIEFASDTVHVEGTVLGESGCHGVEIASTRTTDEGAFRVVVAAVDDAAPNELCTQSLTEIGYEVDAAFTDGVPESVAVVHDDADGRETVATDSATDTA